MSKYLIAAMMMFSASAFAQKELQVIYCQVDSMYMEAYINESLRTLHKYDHKVKSITYNDVDVFISSFMIVYENKK